MTSTRSHRAIAAVVAALAATVTIVLTPATAHAGEDGIQPLGTNAGIQPLETNAGIQPLVGGVAG